MTSRRIIRRNSVLCWALWSPQRRPSPSAPRQREMPAPHARSGQARSWFCGITFPFPGFRAFGTAAAAVEITLYPHLRPLCMVSNLSYRDKAAGKWRMKRERRPHGNDQQDRNRRWEGGRRKLAKPLGKARLLPHY